MGEVLYIEGHFEKNKHSDRVFFKTKDIKLLDSVGQKLTKFITLLIPAKYINEDFLEGLEALCVESKGNHKLKMVLIDQEEQLKLNLVSHEYKINVNHEFVAKLDKMNLKYKVN